MKKIIFIIILLLLLTSFLQAYKILSVNGQKNIQKVISSKPVYAVFTAYNTKLWKESYAGWVKKAKAKGKNVPSFAEMQKDMYEEFADTVNFKGRKWGMKMIKNISSAKKGYVLHINVDEVIPAPMAGLKAVYSVKAYRAGSNKYLFNVKMQIIQLRECTIPRCALKGAGKMLGEEFWGFMKKGK